MSKGLFSRSLAIVGVGIVNGPQPGHTVRTRQAEAARRAIVDAGLKREDIDGAIEVMRSAGAGERVSQADAWPRVLGLPAKFFFRIGHGGGHAAWGIISAAKFLELGMANYVVFSSGVDDWSRSRVRKEKGYRGTPTIMKEGYWGLTFGDVMAASHHSFFATRHMREYGTTSKQLGMIAVQTRQWACKNPEAQMYGHPMTLEDHQNSPILVWPYHLFDICVLSDIAMAFIITTADRARNCGQKPIYVMGIGFGEAMEKLWWEKANYTQLAVRTAKEQAFGQAGITLSDIDVATLYDCFTGEVLFQLEDYGWCKKGEGGPFVADGHIGPGGDIPVNTFGGLLSAYHCSDMGGFAEAVFQLRGVAGERQVPDAEIALVSGHGGEILSPGMCSMHSTIILGR